MEMIRLPDIENPKNDRDIEQIRGYIIRLSRELKNTLESIGEESITPSLRRALLHDTVKEIASLKNSIIKTANEITASGDEIRMELISDYVAKSEIGTYTENSLHQIMIDGKSVTQYFEEISGVSDRMGEAEKSIDQTVTENEALRSELMRLRSYIRTGKLDDGVYGIEIGSFDSDEHTPYKVRLSDNRLAFYIGNTEVAYFSDEAMYISRANVPVSLRIGECLIKNEDGLIFTCS